MKPTFMLQQDGTLRFLLLVLPRNTNRRCSACGYTIRDRRPGPVKRNEGVCIDRVCEGGKRENWIALLCKGCAVTYFRFPSATLADIYWPDAWTENTNVR